MPDEIRLLDHWGIPWTRDEHGRIAQRPFGGHSFPRATLAADKTGFFEMQTLYDQLLRYKSFTRYDEFFVTDMLVEDGRFAGLLGIHAPSGETVVLRGKALLIATRRRRHALRLHDLLGDGDRRRHGDGLPRRPAARGHGVPPVPPDRARADRHPDDRGVPRRGRVPEEQHGRAVHGALRAEQDGAGAARHGVARRETEISRGPRLPGPGRAADYLHLDLTHLGAERINTRLPLIREVCIKFIGVDPIEKPIPIRPVAHYSMGGIETNIDGLTRIPGIWAAGEAACVSLHGANRLGSNSTAECLVWGGITGAEIVKALPVARRSRRRSRSGWWPTGRRTSRTCSRARAPRTSTRCAANCAR